MDIVKAILKIFLIPVALVVVFIYALIISDVYRGMQSGYDPKIQCGALEGFDCGFNHPEFKVFLVVSALVLIITIVRRVSRFLRDRRDKH